LLDPVVDPHEVSIFSEFGDDFSSAYSLSPTCDHCDRDEALLGGSVYSAVDRLEIFCKVADGEVVSETPASFVALPVTLTSSVPVGGGIVCRCVSRQLVCGDVFKVPILTCPRGSWCVVGSHETWQSGLPRLDSELATSVGVYESARASGVPSWNGSESR
jgi:hypothetical protein